MTVKVVLSMILGNEESVIGRCLDHALPHVDGAVLSVNGGDGTSEIATRKITEVCGGDIVQDPWKNFGWNRTRAFRMARSWAISEGFDPRETFVLLIDADMLIRIEDPAYREKLTYPHFYLEQRCGPVLTQNSRLLRLDHDWMCVGSTHEYWAPFPDVQPIPFNGIWIDDVNDGGEHARKYVRDAELLEEAVRENPNDIRALFYLAETYFHWAQQAEEQGDKWLAGQRFRAAIEFYSRRVALGGWDEEKWFADFKRALATMAIERLEKSAGSDLKSAGMLLEAYSGRPGRAEPLAALSRHYRERSRHQLAVHFAKMARETPPTNDFLFVDRRAWDSGPDEDLAICCHYVGNAAEGMAACERLSDSRSNSHWLRGFGADTARWYTPTTVQSKPENELPTKGKYEIPEDLLSGGVFVPSTPTVTMVNGRLFTLVRLVNYRQDRGRCYIGEGPENLIRTRNVFIVEDTVRMIENRLPDSWRPSIFVQGLEDCRLASSGDQIVFTATTYDGDPPTGSPRVVLGTIEQSGDTATVTRVTELNYPLKRDVEKNWVPFFDNGTLFLVYGYEPFVLLKVDTETGDCVETMREELPWCAERWRGGAAARNWAPTKLLLLVHQVTRLEDRNLYFHRFVEIDLTDLSKSRKSLPFSFEHHGIEYAAGLAVGEFLDADSVLVTYSVEDKEAHWIEFSRSQIEEMLQ